MLDDRVTFFATFAHCRLLLPIKTVVTLICNYGIHINYDGIGIYIGIILNLWCCYEIRRVGGMRSIRTIAFGVDVNFMSLRRSHVVII